MAAPGPGRGPSLAGRFAAAIALTIAFYVLAITIAGGLLAVAILPWVWGHGNPFVSITGAGARVHDPRRDRASPRAVHAARRARHARRRSRRWPPSSTTRRAAAARRRRTRST